MEWTERQKQAIEERNCNLLVSAAAGSGKTAVLVERIQRLLLDENCSLLGMLIVTFTQAAAAEMKEKIYKSLSRAVRDDSLSSEKKRFLKRELLSIGRANISTFHKFALEIIHNYYQIIDLKPGLSVLDEASCSILKNEAMEDLFAEKFEADDAEFIHFLDCYCSARSFDTAKEMILKYHNFLSSLPDPEDYMHRAETGFADISAFEEFLSYKAAAEIRLAKTYLEKDYSLLMAEGSSERKACPLLAAKVAEDISALDSLYELYGKKSKDFLPSLFSFEFTRMAATKAEKTDYALIKEESDTLRDFAKKHISGFIKEWKDCNADILQKEQQAMLPNIIALTHLTRRFEELYQDKKLKKSSLDFSDIEHYALKILENPQVQQEYRNRFNYIFIDEYQDSNLVQEALISRICRPDNVFMVGDIKQSIYKFRLAEPEIFASKYARFKSGECTDSKVVDLNSNFRSKSDIINTVNDLFSRIMTEESCGIVYDDDAALYEGNPYTGQHQYPAMLYLADNSSPEDDADKEEDDLKNEELEAHMIAGIIRRYHGTPIADGDCERKLKYSDMVILLRAGRAKGEIYYKVLADAGIPVFLERGEGYFDTPEIKMFLSILKLIDNGRRDIDLISCLLNPVFGFTEEELAKIRIFANGQGNRRLAFCDAFDLYKENGEEPLRQKCTEFDRKIKQLRLQSLYTPLGDFIWELMTNSGFSDYCAALPGGDQRLANLRALSEKAESYQSENAGGLYGFISYIEMIGKKGVKIDTGQVKVLSENADCVRIMTIHKSKGLEFPFVICAGLGSKLNVSTDKIPEQFHKKLGVSMRIVNPKTNLQNDPYCGKIIKKTERDEDFAESLRVLYVAMTRPRDILILTAASGKAEKELLDAQLRIPSDVSSCSTYLSMILPVMRDRVKICRLSGIMETDAKHDDAKTAVRTGLEKGFETSLSDTEKAEIENRLSFNYAAPEELPEKKKYSVSQLALGASDQEEISFRTPNYLLADKKLSAAEKGTAYHTVMEHIPFTAENKTPEAIRDFIEDLVLRDILTRAEGDIVDPARIAQFFTSDIGRRALAAKELHRESPFVLKTEYDGRPVMVQGTIDCWFVEDGKCVLLDYKSNYVDPENKEEAVAHLKETYLPQLALYREALEKICGKPVLEGVLYLFGIGKEIRVN